MVSGVQDGGLQGFWGHVCPVLADGRQNSAVTHLRKGFASGLSLRKMTL